MHARTHTHAPNTNTHSTSPVGILLYVIIRGGCTIKQARVQWLALFSPSEHPWQRAQSHLLLLLLTLLVLQVLHGLQEAAEKGGSGVLSYTHEFWKSSILTFWGNCLTHDKTQMLLRRSMHWFLHTKYEAAGIKLAKLRKKNDWEAELKQAWLHRKVTKSTHNWSSAL